MSLLCPASRRVGPGQPESPSRSGARRDETGIISSAASWSSSSQARRNSFQILDAALAAVLHAVEIAIRRTQQLLRRIAVFGERRNSCAYRQRRALLLRRQPFAHAS